MQWNSYAAGKIPIGVDTQGKCLTGFSVTEYIPMW